MQNKIHLFVLKSLLIIAPSALFFGCGVWADFTTYFNLYYNASDAFSQAEKDINSQKRDLFSTQDLILPQSASTQLTKVVEKCSQILQFHSNSGFVNDALLMLGKSFYYQANYLKALRKFNELIARQPKGIMLLTAELWVGKSQMRLRQFSEGLATLKDVREKALKDDERSIVEDAFIEEIKYKIIQQDYAGAIDLTNQFLSVSKNSEVNAEVSLELGKLYERVQDNKNAIKAFENVSKYSPTFEIQFNALLALGKALRNDNQNQQALDIFDRLKRQQKYSDSLAVIDLQRGLTLIKMDNVKDAMDQLQYVDTAYARTPSSGIASYELAYLYLNNFGNFDSASTYFGKVVTSTAPVKYITDARTQGDLLKSYQTKIAEVNNSKTQILYAVDSTAFKRDSLAYADSLKAREEQQKFAKIKLELEGKDSLAARNRQQIIPNQKPVESELQNLPPLIEPKRPTMPLDSLTNRLVKAEFELGNLLFTEFNMQDSAYKYYYDILTNYPGTPYQARVLFAMGSYYSTLNDSVKADSLFNIIYDNYKKESIVNAAATKLHKPLIDFNYDPAMPLYAEAEKKMMSRNYDSSLTEFYNIYITHRKSPYAAKALYATGWILENKLNLRDSAAVIYDSLTSEFPQSVYAASVLPELTFYRTELARLKKAQEDSLKLASAKTDSLKSGTKLPGTNAVAAKVDTVAKAGVNTAENIDNVEKVKEEERKRLQRPELLPQKSPANPDTLIRIRRKIRER